MAEPHSHDAQPKVSEDTSAAQVHQSRLLHLVPKSTPIWSQAAQIHPVTPLLKYSSSLLILRAQTLVSSDFFFNAHCSCLRAPDGKMNKEYEQII